MDLILDAPRRRWARGEKLAAVAATFSPGITVTEVARNLGISRSMLFAWRKKLRAEAGFPEVTRAPSYVPVKPFIEARYRIRSDRSGIVALSLAGTFAMNLLLDCEPDFYFFNIISPALWWNNREIFRKLAVLEE